MFFQAKIYRNDSTTIRTAVSTAFSTASTYFSQLKIGLILSGIKIADKDFNQLQDTNEYHQKLRKERILPYHDFAVFLLSGKNNGMAWPKQICHPYNGIIVGVS